VDTATRFALGIGLTLAAWLATRLPARAFALNRPAALALDLFGPLAGFAWFLAVTGRPALSGVLGAAVFGGFAFADHAKRRVLMEPAIFSDMSLLILMVRHPALYLAYVGYARMAAIILGLGATIGALALLERPIALWSAWDAPIAIAAALALIWALAGPLLQPAAARLRQLDPTGDPERDAKALGALAMQLTHGVIARAERETRRAAVAPPEPRPRPVCPPRMALPPVVLVQAESFFDARRLHPDIAGDLLPAFESCRASSLQWGRLDVRGRGGNTMRTEFDVLTGLDANAVGLDWRNPYHAFAKAPVDSLAWTLKARGYRTLCIHPYDRSFFDRDRVMPNLGFDDFWGEEAFDGRVRDGRYIADQEVARVAEGLLRSAEGLFVFVITVANHGPWIAPADTEHAASSPSSREHGAPQLLGFLEGIKRSDAMLARIAAAMSGRTTPGLLAFFGDHLPSLPAPFAKLRFEETSTDYFLWRDGEGQAPRRDCAAHELQGAILGALH
jgi:hypothetical protein